MSLILDALNRADKERSAQELAPSLHPSPLPATAAARPFSRPLLAGLVLMIIAALLFFMLPGDIQDKASETVMAVPTAPVSSAPAITLSPQPVMAATPPATATVAPEQDTAAEAVATPLPQSNPVIAGLYQQQVRTEPNTKPSTPAPATKPVRETDGSAILQQIPLLAAMPERFQRSVPSIEYSTHVYNEEDGSGMVNLNGAMWRVGAEIAPGLRVTAILSDSVVLDYHGTHFRLLALNSWVNFP